MFASGLCRAKAAVVQAAGYIKNSGSFWSHIRGLKGEFQCQCGGACDAKSGHLRVVSPQSDQVFGDPIICCLDSDCVLVTKKIAQKIADLGDRKMSAGAKRFQLYQHAVSVIHGACTLFLVFIYVFSVLLLCI